MATDHLYLKDQLLTHRSFFYELYKGTSKQNSKKLDRASEAQINLLIKVLHLICEGDIHLTKESHTNIQKSRRLNFKKKHFNSYAHVKVTLELPMDKKITVLKNLSAVYKQLLYALFNLN